MLALLLATLAPLASAGEIVPYSQARFAALAAAGKPVLLDVQASWCPTCKAQKPILESLMAQPAYRDVTTLTIDFDEDKSLVQRYHVGMQSTLIALHGARETGRSVGQTDRANIEDLVRKTLN
jgi:thiol-disulfide isomerase/thioredoxin